MKYLQSLRFRLVAVVIAIVSLPVIFVWLTSPFDDAVGVQLRQSLRSATDVVGDHVRKSSPDEDFLRSAESFDVRVHVLDHEDSRTFDGSSGPSIRERVMFFPQEVPTLAIWDAEQPPVATRKVVLDAVEKQKAGSCRFAMNDQLLLCEYVQRIDFGSSEPRYVYAVAGSARSLGTLYGERYAVLRLMLVVLLFGGVFGIWLGLRVGRPLSRLRDQVLARTAPPVSTAPIEIEGQSEIAEVGQAFNQLLAALERRNIATEGFMADMAHEVKNPLAAIRAIAESMEDRELDAQRAARVSRILRDSSARLETVVARFLDLAHAESGLPRVEREDVDVRKLLENLSATLSADERYPGVVITCDVVPAFVNGSPEHLETAFRNLVSNAQSFAKSSVLVEMWRADDEIFVRIKDDGLGIRPEDLDRVFDRFFTRRSDGSGTGLGLAMVLAIVEAHAGRITVKSEPESGAEFVVSFPLVSTLSST